MTEQHPITPPPELVKQWVSLACEYEGSETWIDLATQAARWGADQELEACCEWLRAAAPAWERQLRAARRPNPPSLKEQALHILDTHGDLTRAEADTIRSALEQLND